MRAIRKRVKDLNDLEKVIETVSALIELRGEYGLEKKRQKFTEQAMSLISTSSRVAEGNENRQ